LFIQEEGIRKLYSMINPPSKVGVKIKAGRKRKKKPLSFIEMRKEGENQRASVGKGKKALQLFVVKRRRGREGERKGKKKMGDPPILEIGKT